MSPTPRRYQETLDILDELAAEPDAPTKPTMSVDVLNDILSMATSNAAVAQMLYDELRPSRNTARSFLITPRNEAS